MLEVKNRTEAKQTFLSIQFSVISTVSDKKYLYIFFFLRSSVETQEKKNKKQSLAECFFVAAVFRVWVSKEKHKKQLQFQCAPDVR